MHNRPLCYQPQRRCRPAQEVHGLVKKARFSMAVHNNECDYFGARYYGTKIGRFTTVDPAYVLQENLVDPQRWNKYAYSRNNPLTFVEPDGRDWTDSTIGFLGGAANTYVEMVAAPFVSPYVSTYQAATDPAGTFN